MKKEPGDFEGVSIPHRYCKNPFAGFERNHRSGVSIPHRYCKNKEISIYVKYANKGFNSS